MIVLQESAGTFKYVAHCAQKGRSAAKTILSREGCWLPGAGEKNGRPQPLYAGQLWDCACCLYNDGGLVEAELIKRWSHEDGEGFVVQPRTVILVLLHLHKTLKWTVN